MPRNKPQSAFAVGISGKDTKEKIADSKAGVHVSVNYPREYVFHPATKQADSLEELEKEITTCIRTYFCNITPEERTTFLQRHIFVR